MVPSLGSPCQLPSAMSEASSMEQHSARPSEACSLRQGAPDRDQVYLQQQCYYHLPPCTELGASPGAPPGVLTSRFYGNGEQHSSGCCHSNLCINEDPGMRADPRVALVMNTLPSLPQPRFTQHPQEVSTHILRNDSLCF